MYGANHTKKYGWVQIIDDNNDDHRRANFDTLRNSIQEVNGELGCIVTRSGAGKRVIILHIDRENGFFEWGTEWFIGNKASSDFHDEMNAQDYEEWFRRILVTLPDKSALSWIRLLTILC